MCIFPLNNDIFDIWLGLGVIMETLVSKGGLLICPIFLSVFLHLFFNNNFSTRNKGSKMVYGLLILINGLFFIIQKNCNEKY